MPNDDEEILRNWRMLSPVTARSIAAFFSASFTEYLSAP
jgi:hypothetical protein